MTDPARADYRLRSRPNVIFGEADSRRVWVDEVELTPEESWTYRIHSPDGFAWGYGGSGPSQLALAILLRMTGDKEFSLLNYQSFKSAFLVKPLPDKDLWIPLKNATD